MDRLQFVQTLLGRVPISVVDAVAEWLDDSGEWHDLEILDAVNGVAAYPPAEAVARFRGQA